MAAQATIISVISKDAGQLCSVTDAAATNVHAVAEPDDGENGPDRSERWREAKRKPPVYVLVPFDPLQPLVDAWAARLSGIGDDFEVTAGTVGNTELPDYYIVDERLDDPRRAWYFELLYSVSPARVAAFDRTVEGLIGSIRSLRPGRSFPDAAALADEARTFVPGTTGLVKPQKQRRIHVM